MNKFLGMGLRPAVMIALFTMLFIVMGKVVFAKYPITGVTEFFHAV